MHSECYFALKAWNAQRAGAAAVLIADSVDEQLLTMDSPEASPGTEYIDKINIPSALVNRAFGESLKKMTRTVAGDGEEVVVKLDWRESMPHPDERVEYEFWTNSNDECGPRCDEQAAFVRAFRGHAQLLEKGGYALFTPHYITWLCPHAFRGTPQCKAQCINRGRYCAPDPEGDLAAGYDGRDVVVENLRQLCVHRVANASSRPWIWWDYVADYHLRCSMKENKYTRRCAEDVVRSLGGCSPDGDRAHCFFFPPEPEWSVLIWTSGSALQGCRWTGSTSAWGIPRPTPRTTCSRRSRLFRLSV